MIIRWLGRACFLLVTQGGTRIVIDPFDPSVGYPPPCVDAHAVTVSHGHHDHNHVEAVGGDPVVIESEGRYRVREVDIAGYPCFHDELRGEKRGDNLAFAYDADGVKVCHLGDLGHLLEEPLLGEIGPVDVLLLPVGGVYTLDPAEAWALAQRMQPRVVIPMHYQTPPLGFPLAPVDDFLALAGQPGAPVLPELDTANLAHLPFVVVLDWQKN